ncbi:MAG: hypothetical protein ACI352_03200, partial [Elusimicrobiaceae bacterium]
MVQGSVGTKISGQEVKQSFVLSSTQVISPFTQQAFCPLLQRVKPELINSTSSSAKANLETESSIANKAKLFKHPNILCKLTIFFTSVFIAQYKSFSIEPNSKIFLYSPNLFF